MKLKKGCLDLDGMLSLPDDGAKREAFFDHLEICPVCARLFEEQVIAPVAGLVGRLAHESERSVDIDCVRMGLVWRLAATFAAVACVAAIFMHGRWISNSPEIHPASIVLTLSVTPPDAALFPDVYTFNELWTTVFDWGPGLATSGNIGFDDFPFICPSLLDRTVFPGQYETQGFGVFEWAPSLQKTYMEVHL